MGKRSRRNRTFHVVRRGRHYAIDLPDWTGVFDSFLHYRYSPGGGTDSPYDYDTMHAALDELYQERMSWVKNNLRDGDIFDTPFGKFICRGVHVVPYPS